MRLKLLLIAIVLAAAARANQRYSNFCEIGGRTVLTAGVPGSQKVQGSYPQCLVTVYLTGTLTLATIYSNNSSTALANPFTAQVNGSFFFYAANGRYDVTISGGGLPSPYTFGDVLFADPSGVSPITFQYSATWNPADWTAVIGTQDMARFVVNSYPITKEAGWNTIPIVQGLVGAVNVPSNSTVTNSFGLGGYAIVNSTTGAAVGVYGQGLLGAQSGAWGANFITYNAATQGGTGIQGNLWGVEVDVSTSAAGAAPANARGISVVSDMYQVPVVINSAFRSELADGAVGVHPFNVAFDSSKGSAATALLAGPVATGNSQPSQLIELVGTSAGGATLVSNIVMDSSGNLSLRTNTGNNLYLGDNSGTAALSVNTAQKIVTTGVSAVFQAPVASALFNNSVFQATIDGRIGSTSPDPATVRNHINDSTAGMGNIGVSGTVVVPAGSTTTDADAVFGQITNSSTATSAVAGSFWCQSRVAATWCFALNPLVSDYDPVAATSVAAHLRGAEWDINVANAGTSVEGQLFGGASTVQPAGSTAITFGALGSAAGSGLPWDIGIWGYPGGISSYGLLLDAAGPCLLTGCVSKTSQKIGLKGRDGAGAEQLMAFYIDSAGNGTIITPVATAFAVNGSNVALITSTGLNMSATYDIFDYKIRSGAGTYAVCVDTNGKFTSTATTCTTSTSANTALSNLTTTSINQDLLPSATLARNLGSAAAGYLHLYSASMVAPTGSGGLLVLADGANSVGIGNGGGNGLLVSAAAVVVNGGASTYLTGYSGGVAKSLCIGADDHVYAKAACP